MTNRTPIIAIIVALAALLAAACGSDSDSKPLPSDSGTQPESSSRSQRVEITPEDLLAVTLQPEDVEDLFPLPESWWPTVPQFNVGIGDEAPGLQFYVANGYQQVGELSSSRVETTLIIYETASDAGEDFDTRLLEENDADGEVSDGPSAGDDHRYFTRMRSGEDNPYETTLRFRSDRIVGRISVFHQLGYEEIDTLAAYAEPVTERASRALSGDFSAKPLPEAIENVLPPSEASRTVGPAMGSAVLPVESWALMDTSGDPEAVREYLLSLGADSIGFRRYGIAGDPEHVVEVTLFPFPDDEAARTWVSDFVGGVEPSLDPGDTGSLSAFTDYGDAYELQFARGSYVADVFCSAPFSETTPACEEPVRALAELWYTHLPASPAVQAEPTAPPVQGSLAPSAGEPVGEDRPATEHISNADPAFVDSWRIYSEYIYYDAGGSGGSDSSASGTTRLELNADGTWQFGSSAGSWTIEPIAPSDWDRWGVSAYGPERKVVLQGWKGGVEDGPIEESAGYVDFVWVIYHVDSPDPGLIYIKFGH